MTASQKGPPSLAKIRADGKQITLHSSYDPVKEAQRLIDSEDAENRTRFLVLGLGLGYHLQELVRRVPRSSRIMVFEKDAEILFHCLANNDFSSVLVHPGVCFQVAKDVSSLEAVLEPDRTGFALNGYSVVKLQALVSSEFDYYSSLLKKIDSVFTETQIDLKTQAAFSKLFYRNIFDNWKSILNSTGVRSLENKCSGIPAIIVSAGPSLDKNISILKKSSHRAVVIAVATALRPLIENGIRVDFVVVIDPDEATVQFFEFDKIPKNVCLIFDPCAPASIIENYPHRKIRIDSEVYLSQWLASKQEENNFLGKTLSVAHTAFSLAGHLGCEPIILTGQDLSFHRNRLHCAGSYYDLDRKDKIGRLKSLKNLEEARYAGFSPSFKSVEDIFEKEIVTTSALNSYKDIFAEKMNGKGSVYNATEGGLPIPGVPSISLKEAVNELCLTGKWSQTTNVDVLPMKSFQKVKSEVMAQGRRFGTVVNEIATIKSNYLNSSECSAGLQEEFVMRMEKLYRALLDDSETLQLMQGYSYGGFIEWKQESEKNVIQEEMASKEVLASKFQRDIKFVEVLQESAETLRNEFNKMAEEMN
ncbi:MAG: hypothetical protein NPINA01_12160 [Nitrospinaceae bacterium]|nr:MAG: hypothetical protein NPINA01_12160 [Nitrospinaceae bacterium]